MKNRKAFTCALTLCLVAAILFTGCAVIGKVQGMFDRLFSGKGGGASASANEFTADEYTVFFTEVTRGTEEDVFGYDIKGMLLDSFTPYEGFDFFFLKIDRIEQEGVEQDLFQTFEKFSLSKFHVYENGEEVDNSLSISNEEKGYIALVLVLPTDHADSYDVEVTYDTDEESAG